LGATNRGEDALDVNISLSLGGANEWIEAGTHGQHIEVSELLGAFVEARINSTSSFGPYDISLGLPEGDWTVTITFSTADSISIIEHRVITGGV
jgi:hypothetical protein